MAEKLGIGTPQTLLAWVRKRSVTGSVPPGLTTLNCGGYGPRTRNCGGPTKSGSGLDFLRGGARPPTPIIVQFISENKNKWGVEPICRVLSEHGCQIAPSTYYDAVAQGASKRQQRHAQLRGEITRVHAENFSVYGARKVWMQLNREGITVARCTVEHLMTDLGLRGVVRGKAKRTTISDPTGSRPADLVNRNFRPPTPNRLWVADITDVSTWSGTVYTAFVIDAFARRIIGWRTGTTLATSLVLDAIDHAIWTREHAGIVDMPGLIQHSDRGSQYMSIKYSERLAESANSTIRRHHRKFLRQCPRRKHQRPLQNRPHQTKRTLADGRPRRARHHDLGRLV